MMRVLFAMVLGLALLFLPNRARADGPRTVFIGTYVNHEYGIDIKNSQCTIDFYVWSRWDGDDLEPHETFEVAGGRVALVVIVR
jgi:hypothetical protein